MKTPVGVAATVLVLLIVQASGGLDNPGGDQVIDILHFGNAFFYSTGAVPYTHLREEPAIRLSTIPSLWARELGAAEDSYYR